MGASMVAVERVRRRSTARATWVIASALCLAMAACSSYDDREARSAAEHEAAALAVPNAKAGSGPTGWYLPTGLPHGWSLARAEVVGTDEGEAGDDPSTPCACLLQAWRAQDGRPFVIARQSGQGVDAVLDRYPAGSVTTEPTRIWHDDGQIVRPDTTDDDDAWPLAMVVVSDGTEVLQVVGVENDLHAIRQTAIDWAFGAIPEPQIEEGTTWTPVSAGSRASGEASPGARLTWATPNGEATIDLVPTGTRPFLPVRFPKVAGDELAIEDAPSGGLVRFLAGTEARVPNVDADSHGAGPSDRLVAALEPATSEAWRTALAQVEHPAALDVATLADLVDRAERGGAQTVQVRTVLDDPQTGSADVDGLAVTLAITSTEAKVGTPLSAALLLRNTTNRPMRLTECNDAAMRWGLVREDQVTDGRTDVELPSQNWADCFPTIRAVIAPGETHRQTLSSPPTTTSLPPGRYRLAAEVAGRTSQLRVVDPRTIVVAAS